jgi:Flp pilus assembly pilin Flp
MKKHFQKLFARVQKRSGASLVEYALILALISVVAIRVLKGVGQNVNTKLRSVNSNLASRH